MDLVKSATGTALVIPLVTYFHAFLFVVACIIAFFILKGVFKTLASWGQEIKEEAERLTKKEKSVKTGSL